MKTFKTMILQNNRPVEDGMDLALVYAEAGKEKLLSFIEERASALERVKENLEVVQGKKSYLPGVIIAAISAIILCVTIITGTKGIVGKIGIAGTGAGILIAIIAVIIKKKKVKKLEQEQQGIENREVPDAVSHIGKMNYMLEVIPFEGGKMVVDTSGIQERTKFVYPGIPGAVNRFKEIVETMKQLPDDLAILLPPAPPTGDRGEEPLTGIEGDMARILSLTRELLDEKIDSAAEVPAFFTHSDVVQSLDILSSYLEEEGESGIGITQPEEVLRRSLEDLKAINDNAKEIEKQGGDNDENIMRHVRDQMEMQITRSKQARDYSLIDILEKNLDQLKSLYDYPLTRFYCPKCHKVPGYIAGNLPVPLDELNERPIHQLNGFYKSDEIVHFRKLGDNIRNHLDQARRDGEDLHNEHYRVLENKLISYEEKIRELALEIEGIDPKAEIHSRNAVLKYNTLHGYWKCQLCGETFTMEEAQWARMLKIKDDLILPVWDKLWLEKHDESMRIIREKEAELRKNKELESRQLREEANVFTQGYREVRNQLEEADAGCQGIVKQFQMMCNFFEGQQILAPEKVAGLRNSMTDSMDTEVQQITADTDRLENQLEQEPETVFLRRGQLADHTEEVRNTRKYFRPAVQGLPMIEEEVPAGEKQQQEQEEETNV
jgi:hypothetical protein